MAWQRLTVFRDAPDPAILRSVLVKSCRLFRSQSTRAYFLEPKHKHNETLPLLGGYYDSMFKPEGPFNIERLEAFETANAEHKKAFYIHYEIAREAIFASRVFQTEVLSSYSNDEEDDFVAVAKSGELTHIRFKGHRKALRTLSGEEAANTDTEFQAKRMDPPGKIAEDAPVCEYEAYEARMSPETGLAWHPYWRYIEGELNAQGILKTLSQDPPDIPGSLMFRCANLEFRDRYGSFIPDTYHDKDDYLPIGEYAPTLRTSLENTARTAIGSIFASIYRTQRRFIRIVKKHWKYVLLLVTLIALGAIKSRLPPSEEDLRKLKFGDHCRNLDGALEKREAYSGFAGRDQCRIGDLAYLEHELPGKAGEVRRIAGTLEKKVCTEGSEEVCLFFNGVRLDAPLADANIATGDAAITVLMRTQICDYRASGSCDDGRPVFEYEIGTMFSTNTSK